MAKKHHGMSERTYSEPMDVQGHGSPKATHEIHGGKAGVPRELCVGAGPGHESEDRGSTSARRNFEGGAKTSGKPPRGMKTYREE